MEYATSEGAGYSAVGANAAIIHKGERSPANLNDLSTIRKRLAVIEGDLEGFTSRWQPQPVSLREGLGGIDPAEPAVNYTNDFHRISDALSRIERLSARLNEIG